MARLSVLVFSSIFLIVNCLDSPKSQMGLEANWTGIDLETNQPVDLSESGFDTLALNVYSPTCIPCFKELPALERIASRLKKDTRFGLYLVVDPISVSETTSGDYGTDEPLARATAIMKAEVKKRGISIPILLMNQPFSVSNEAFVTATPETIIIRTKPWNIYYNFIGSLSEKEEISQIDADPRVQFFFHTMGARNL
ncbi:MAG: TlpA family protein disulfide reductase [Leptospira sp.]|nr:TlpA family protein disulfide reductase [Leptospira sp.]NCS95035.1 TlpA family protein disulfide reductase [Leptospira sp.]